LSGQCSITAQGLADQVAGGGGAGGCHLMEVGPFRSSYSPVDEYLPGRFLLLAVSFRHCLRLYGSTNASAGGKGHPLAAWHTTPRAQAAAFTDSTDAIP